MTTATQPELHPHDPTAAEDDACICKQCCLRRGAEVLADALTTPLPVQIAS